MAIQDHIISRTVRGLPAGEDKGGQLRIRLRERRKHKRKWPEPSDAGLILNLHFAVHSFRRQSYHADATLEVPVAAGFEYASISAGAKTRADALLLVIREIESSFWFSYMRENGVRFRVTGAGVEELYHGYL